MSRPFLFIVLMLGTRVYSQTFEYVYRNPKDSLVNCYLKVIPPAREIKGLIVRDYGALPDTSKKSKYKLQSLASTNGLMTIYTVTSKFWPEMYYNDSFVTLLDEIVHEVITRYKINKHHIFIGGLSASGTRALRYAQYCEEGKSKYGLKVKGVFAVDPPLDLERFYQSAKNHMGNFKAGMLDEAIEMIRILPQKLGGTPEQVPQNYTRASVYSERDSAGGNAVFYKQVSIIIFHEPDIDWWLYARGATYFDINSYDIAGFVNRLNLLGSNKIEMVTTTGKGVDWEGKRNCHSWSIVDEDYLMKWILTRISE